MKVEIEVFGCLCELSVFRINGITADYTDFGDKYDCEPESAEPYGCGNMRFFPKEYSASVLKKYNITKEEYNEVCNRLDCLSFGCCGWCV